VSRPQWVRVAAVLAAILAGGALTAYLVLPRDGAAGDGVAAGLATPPVPASATAAGPSSTALQPAPSSSGGSDPSLPSLRAAPATPGVQTVTAAPTRVVVRRLGIDMTVEPQGVLPNGQMALPVSPEVAGWYRFGSAPDDPAGATVMAAHVDSKTGIGPFASLGTARVGDEVDVWVGSDRRAYRVTEVVRVDKLELDRDGLFAMAGPPRLHLVTCTGDYVSGSGYTQNLVVIAERM
jgi:LPXTG-site transpeptidase (sortase) family protein